MTTHFWKTEKWDKSTHKEQKPHNRNFQLNSPTATISVSITSRIWKVENCKLVNRQTSSSRAFPHCVRPIYLLRVYSRIYNRIYNTSSKGYISLDVMSSALCTMFIGPGNSPPYILSKAVDVDPFQGCSILSQC